MYKSCAFLLMCFLPLALLAQDKPKMADDHADWVARGTLKVIAPEPLEEELITGPVELYEIRKGIPGLDYTPNFEAKSEIVFEKAKEVIMRRAIWNLEFSFRPVRTVMVNVPEAEGRVKRKKIWYLLYRVRNLGGHWQPLVKDNAERKETDVQSLIPADVESGSAKIDDLLTSSIPARKREELSAFTTNDPPNPLYSGIRFIPHFVLEAHEFDKEYLDRIIPTAIEVIAKKERVGREIFDSISITKQKLELTTAEKDNGVWGVATWEDVDPRIDFFSIYLQGLTNAFKVKDSPEKFKQGDLPATARSFSRKTLQLHFWHPGDTIDIGDKDFHFGMPKEQDPALQSLVRKKYGFKDPLDYRWVYR